MTEQKTTFLPFKKQRLKITRMNFWDCHGTLHEAPNGRTHSLRKTVCFTTIK